MHPLDSESWCGEHGPRRRGVLPDLADDAAIGIKGLPHTSFEDAVNVGLDRANTTLRSVKSAWIKEQSVDVENGVIVAYRVNLLVTFVLE